MACLRRGRGEAIPEARIEGETHMRNTLALLTLLAVATTVGCSYSTSRRLDLTNYPPRAGSGNLPVHTESGEGRPYRVIAEVESQAFWNRQKSLLLLMAEARKVGADALIGVDTYSSGGWIHYTGRAVRWDDDAQP